MKIQHIQNHQPSTRQFANSLVIDNIAGGVYFYYCAGDWVFLQVGIGTNNQGGGIPTTQPSSAGLWSNNGVLTYWDGTDNNSVDFNDGDSTSVFGTPLGDI